ncbi:Transposable element Tc3 transposase [Aphis craccivora]|uniref:Transposable element Tc3 transposase n=1 Tax=Aphis craccivora TaxID=307492 RepID=A0A6G0YT00_APHCR|nr:Transposable element Tc3 transposase [Aphis craccivora]
MQTPKYINLFDPYQSWRGIQLVLIYAECQHSVRLNQEGRFPGKQINQQRRRAIFDEDTELQVNTN